MQFDVQFVAFITASVVIIVVPGVDFALVTRQVVRYGRTAGFTTLAGLVVGGTIHATLATLGLSVLLISTPQAYTVLRIAGALYLGYLGTMALWATVPRRSSPLVASPDDPAVVAAPAATGSVPAGTASGPAAGRPLPPRPEEEPVDVVRRRAFGMGITSNLLNPKVIVFYVSFVPQFVTPGPGAAARTALLATMFITLAVIWWICYILLIDRLHAWLTRPRVRVAIERLTGLTLLAFAVKLAFDF
jgi:threonine/homoserine/homoserine lactone efflux protein